MLFEQGLEGDRGTDTESILQMEEFLGSSRDGWETCYVLHCMGHLCCALQKRNLHIWAKNSLAGTQW